MYVQEAYNPRQPLDSQTLLTRAASNRPPHPLPSSPPHSRGHSTPGSLPQIGQHLPERLSDLSDKKSIWERDRPAPASRFPPPQGPCASLPNRRGTLLVGVTGRFNRSKDIDSRGLELQRRHTGRGMLDDLCWGKPSIGGEWVKSQPLLPWLTLSSLVRLMEPQVRASRVCRYVNQEEGVNGYKDYASFRSRHAPVARGRDLT